MRVSPLTEIVSILRQAMGVLMPLRSGRIGRGVIGPMLHQLLTLRMRFAAVQMLFGRLMAGRKPEDVPLIFQQQVHCPETLKLEIIGQRIRVSFGLQNGAFRRLFSLQRKGFLLLTGGWFAVLR